MGMAHQDVIYIALRGNWCDIIVMNALALTHDDSKDSFFEELE
jgi:hypothetical protein